MAEASTNNQDRAAEHSPRRRAFFRGSLAALSAAAVGSVFARSTEAAGPDIRPAAGPPDQVAKDEAYWRRVRSAFREEGEYTWLSYGAGGVVPQFIIDQMHVYASQAATGAWDLEALRGIKESGSSAALRERMAQTFGCDPSEIALTRNTMEALATCLLGTDLRRGDEVLTTTSDYDSCIAILKQREAREGIRVRLVDIPIPVTTTQAVLDAIEQAITPRTRVILVSHMTYGTGLILPIREIADLARRRGILSVVDGAHSIGHLDFRIDELGCDCFASCLHKWFTGPRGTGLLYVRKDRIRDIWPLFAPYSGKGASDIEKFEESGSVSKAVPAVLPQLFDFNARIGIRARQERLRYLRDRWAKPLERHERIQLWTNLDPRWSCGFGAFRIEGMDTAAVMRALQEKYRLRVRALGNPYLPQIQGLNVGAALVNTPEQVDRLVGALEEIMRGA